MQTRFRAAATALLLTATTGLAATGAAQASGTHHPGARGASKLVVTIKTKAHSLKLSDSKIRPGNTMFKDKNAGGTGLIQLLRLKPGYTLPDAFSDFALAFPEDPTAPPDVAAVRRVDKNVVFYGGMETPHKPGKANMWAVKIDKGGTYYAVNLDANSLTALTVKGHSQKRAMPSADGVINAAQGPGGVGNQFKPGKHNARKGWMSTTNTAKEPHFVILQHVKKGTTKKQVFQAFTSPDPPTIFLKGSTDTGVISPHHTFLWSYGLPKGRYAVTCFWPSKADGMPHALMGMISVFNMG
jgi:hypothetical protein